MNRCKFGGVLLILLLGLSLLSTHAVRSCHEPLSADLRQASAAGGLHLLFGDDAPHPHRLLIPAHAVVRRLLRQRFQEPGVDGQLAQLRVYLRARESTAAAALCADLARQMEAMADAHILNLMNLL